MATLTFVFIHLLVEVKKTVKPRDCENIVICLKMTRKVIEQININKCGWKIHKYLTRKQIGEYRTKAVDMNLLKINPIMRHA